jgi:CubicO group peptidase (beta-lactamase class C family)
MKRLLRQHRGRRLRWGLRLKPRDLAKLGQLMVDDGRRNGKQVLPYRWAVEWTRPRINTFIKTEGYGALSYGYGQIRKGSLCDYNCALIKQVLLRPQQQTL